jgi:hypothetical protein
MREDPWSIDFMELIHGGDVGIRSVWYRKVNCMCFLGSRVGGGLPFTHSVPNKPTFCFSISQTLLSLIKNIENNINICFSK